MEFQPTQTPDNHKLFDSSLLTHAWEFAAAADAYAKADNLRSWMPLYFLFCRAMELAMKAFAIRHGATEKELRNAMWHDLGKCLAFVEARGFVLSPPLDDQERRSLLLLNDHYAGKLLEYPPLQGYAVPQPFIIRGIVDRMIAAAFIAIWGVERYACEIGKAKTLGLCLNETADYGAPIRGYSPSEGLAGDLTGGAP